MVVFIVVLKQARTLLACSEEAEEGAQPQESVKCMEEERGVDVDMG